MNAVAAPDSALCELVVLVPIRTKASGAVIVSVVILASVVEVMVMDVDGDDVVSVLLEVVTMVAVVERVAVAVVLPISVTLEGLVLVLV